MKPITPPKYIEKLETMKDDVDELVICSWINECDNYGIHCYHCKWNAGIGIGNYLEKNENSRKTLRYLDNK